MTDKKPPIGVMPESLYERKRIKELADAISLYAEENRLDEPSVIVWSLELVRRLEGLRFNHDEELLVDNDAKTNTVITDEGLDFINSKV